MRIINRLIITSLLSVFLVSCGGGNGSGDPVADLTHNELAEQFVRELNATGNYDVEIVKSSTLQYNYVVVYDRDFGTYDAYDLTNYSVGSDVTTFVSSNANSFFIDLRRIPGYYETTLEWDYYYNTYTGDYEWGWVERTEYIPTRYRDPITGILFEKNEDGIKDLEKIAAFQEHKTISKSADTIVTKFGLSAERATEVAKLAVQWEKNKKSFTDSEHDEFSKEVLGVTITEAKEAIQKSVEGDSTDLESVINTAANVNGITPEAMNEIVVEFFTN